MIRARLVVAGALAVAACSDPTLAIELQDDVPGLAEHTRTTTVA